MKPFPYLVGVVISAVALFFAYTGGGFHSVTTFYVAALASTYVILSSLAFVVGRCGSTKRSKGWAFFGSGIVLLFGYLPSLRSILSLFYLPHAFDDMRVEHELFFYAPMIISALCIFRGVSLWADESLEKKEPNQSLEPTRVLGTSAAEPPRVPSTRVAHL